VPQAASVYSCPTAVGQIDFCPTKIICLTAVGYVQLQLAFVQLAIEGIFNIKIYA
jgi:hypothetical protein